jgi:hypothetical protein
MYDNLLDEARGTPKDNLQNVLYRNTKAVHDVHEVHESFIHMNLLEWH